jgi:hypothetical protein
MKHLKKLLHITIIAVLFSACSGKKMNVSGIVTNTHKQPLSGVYVFAGTQMVQTDEDGTFVFESVDAGDARPLIKFSKNGYFTLVRSLNADEEINQIRVQLIEYKNTEHVKSFTFRSEQDEALIGSGKGAMLNIKASAIEGNSINASVHFASLDPLDVNQISKLPGGDFKAGNPQKPGRLRCYSIAMVEIISAEGKTLNLKNNGSARIKFPMPQSLASSPPQSIDMWHFNEANGIWEAGGSAVLKEGHYLADVTHFSSWGIGEASEDVAFLEGRVTDRNGRGVSGVEISADQTAVITDEYGYYKAVIPALKECKIEMNYRGFMISLLSEAVEPGKKTKMDLSVPPMTYIKGEAIGCNGKGTPALITITWDDADFSQIYTRNGVFELSLPTMVTDFNLTAKSKKFSVNKSLQNKNAQAAINTGKSIVCSDENEDGQADNRKKDGSDINDGKNNDKTNHETKNEKETPKTAGSYIVLDGGTFDDLRILLDKNTKSFREQHYNHGSATTDIILNIEAESVTSKDFSWYLYIHEFKPGTYKVRPPEISQPAGIQIYSGIKINGFEISFRDMEVKINSIGDIGKPISGSIIFREGTYRNPATNELFQNISAVGEFSIIRTQ